MNSSSSPDLNALLGANAAGNAAVAGGPLGNAAVQALHINDLGQQIQNGLGVSVDDVTSSDVILVQLVVDDSSSIRFVQGNTEAVRSGVNGILESLADTKQKDSIFVYCVLLNGGTLYPVTPLIDGATGKLNDKLLLSVKNYNPSGGTPFYDTATVALGTAMAKYLEFAGAGVPARTITILITDGEDQGSVKNRRPEDVKPVVEDMWRTEMHIVIGMGIDDGHTDFKDVFGRMGIPNGRDKSGREDPSAPNWVLTPQNDPSSIRRACMMVSQSAVRASQTPAGANFSNVAGGFGG